MSTTDEDSKYLMEHDVHVKLELALARVLERRLANPIDALAADLAGRAFADPADETAVALTRLRAIRVLHPQHRAAKYFDTEYFWSLERAQRERLLRILRPGIADPTSEVGCLALAISDCDTFKPYFAQIAADYHRVPPTTTQPRSDWAIPPTAPADLAACGAGAAVVAATLALNIAPHALAPELAPPQRLAVEAAAAAAVAQLAADPAFGGAYRAAAASPQSPEAAADAAAGLGPAGLDPAVAADWPVGRGVYTSADGGVVVAVGGEAHVRVSCAAPGGRAAAVAERLRAAVAVLERAPHGLLFAKSPTFGVVAASPEWLGAGLRVSVAVPGPLAAGAAERAAAAAAPFGVVVAPAAGGGVEFATTAKWGVTEGEIFAAALRAVEAWRKVEPA